MSLDLYQPCPCGLGKNIKFCCKDVAHEMDSVSRKINGGQLKAAEEEVDKHLEKHPDRACFWALKSTILLEQGNIDDLREVTEKFLKVAPENPIALSSASLLAATDQPTDEEMKEDRVGPTESCRRSVDLLQKALECCPSGIPIQIYDALGVLADRLIAEGQYLSGREHLAFQVLLDKENAQIPYSKLIRISRAPSISLLLRQDMTVPPCPGGVPWEEEYSAAVAEGSRGLWRKAAEGFEALVAKNQAPAIHRAMGVIYCRLAENQKAIEAWRAYARCEGTPKDDAVEAEALAQLLDPVTNATKTEMVRVTQPLKDVEAALTALQADAKARGLNLNPEAFAGMEGPPPKAGFYLNDRESPEADGVKVEDLPIALCELLLYGKETDRPGRLTYSTARTKLEECGKAVKEVVGDQLDGKAEEEVLGEIPLVATATMVRTQIPREVEPNRRRELSKEFNEQMLKERWSKTPLDVLGGKTPTQAAGDKEHELALAAAILVIETSMQENSVDMFDRLRDHVKIEKPARITPDAETIRNLPLVRFHRIDASNLDDDNLMTCFAVASQSQHIPAIMLMAEEMLSRESLKDKVNRAELFGTMAAAVSDLDEALRLTLDAQKAAAKQGKSPAKWKVSEFSLRIMRNESAEAQAILNEVQSRHIKEPGIKDLLVQELAKFGLIRPREGAGPAAPAPPANPAAPDATTEPTIVTSGDIPAQPEGEGQKESKLWLPGD